MWATVISWLSGAWAKIALAGAALAALFTVYETIKGSGETEQQNADLKKGLEDVAVSQKIDASVAGTSDADVDHELRATYSRD